MKTQKDPPRQNILFVCTYNEIRSSTAETVYAAEGLSVKSAGTYPWSPVPVSADLLSWADLIFVMETGHKEILDTKYEEVLKNKQIIVLDIAGSYDYMEPSLVEIIKQKVGQWIKSEGNQ